jgi:hypothetical protein
MGHAPDLFIHTVRVGKSKNFFRRIAIFWSHDRLQNQTAGIMPPLCGNFAVRRLETIEFK